MRKISFSALGFAIVVGSFVGFLWSTGGASAQVHGQGSTTANTPTAEASATEVAVTATSVARPTSGPIPSTAAISARLVEDANANGVADAPDRSPQQTLVQLIPWSPASTQGVATDGGAGEAGVTADGGAIINLLTDPDGTFSFTNMPPGDYTLLVWWEAGFVAGASPTVPDVFQAVFSVGADGNIAAPLSYPAVWPGVRGDTTHPSSEVSTIGRVPGQILLKLSPPGLVPYPVGTGGSERAVVGTADVALELGLPSAGIALPSTGEGFDAGDPVQFVVVLAALAVMLIGAVTVSIRARRSR